MQALRRGWYRKRWNHFWGRPPPSSLTRLYWRRRLSTPRAARVGVGGQAKLVPPGVQALTSGKYDIKDMAGGLSSVYHKHVLMLTLGGLCNVLDAKKQVEMSEDVQVLMQWGMRTIASGAMPPCTTTPTRRDLAACDGAMRNFNSAILGRAPEGWDAFAGAVCPCSVSYTHLTLPTIYSV